MTAYLTALAKRYPNVPAALAELANLESILKLPSPTVHVVSDVHGECVKLTHGMHNALGILRPLFDRLFGGRLPLDEIQRLLSLVYYPHETWLALGNDRSAASASARAGETPDDHGRRHLAWFVPLAAEVLRELAR